MLRRGWLAAVIGASAAVVLAPSAQADGPDVGRASWTGLYLGLQAGAAWSDTDWTGPANFFGVSTFSTTPDGGLFGGHIGYNLQMGPWVLGAEVSYSGSTLRSTEVGPVPVFPQDSFSTDIEDLFTATARIGYATSTWMVYARGGYANSEVTLSGLSGPPVAGVTFNTSERIDGWTAGAGLEYKLTRNMVLGLEYNFVSLSGSFATTTDGAVPGIPIAVDLDSDIHTVKGRFSVLLN
jgi:opacity protein-like surface antigen